LGIIVVSTIYLLCLLGMWVYFCAWRRRHGLAAQVAFWVIGALAAFFVAFSLSGLLYTLADWFLGQSLSGGA